MVATKTTDEIIDEGINIGVIKSIKYGVLLKHEWDFVSKEWVSLDELRKYIDEKLEYDFCDNDWERGFQDGLKHIKERFFVPEKKEKVK